MFHPAFPVASLTPASYNPRAISPDALDRLMESIQRVGFVKPIIVTQTGTIVAGHQRSKAAAALGWATVPAWVLAKSLPVSDEIRFNQLHNGTDLDAVDQVVRVPAGPPSEGEFDMVPPADLVGSTVASGATVRGDICWLLNAHGNWGGAVVDEDGEVLSGQQYVLACKLMRLPARIWRVARRDRARCVDAFARQYGEFDYRHLTREGYLQSFAQPYRLGPTDTKNRSRLYEGYLYPLLEERPGLRVLDFGAGQCAYANAAKAVGLDVVAYEPWRRRGTSLDPGAVHQMVADVCRALTERGLFDVVLCEAVVNSVDSQAAEDVLCQAVSALVKPGGTILMSGRQRERVEGQRRAKRSAERNDRQYAVFLDRDGLTAQYRGSGQDGGWFFQKFHTRAKVGALVRRWFNAEGVHRYGQNSACWQIVATQTVPVPQEAAEEALAVEFNLPWPGGKRINRAAEIVAAYRAALALG